MSETTDIAAWLDREQRQLDAETEEMYARWRSEDKARIEATLDAEEQAQRREAALVAEQAQKLVVAAERRSRQAVTRSAAADLSAAERSAEESAALAAAKRADEWREIAKRAETRAAVVKEPDIYGPTSRHSHFLDVATITSPIARPEQRAAAQDRLERYGKALARDMGKAGIRARAIWREASRKAADLEERSREEFRAMSSGSGSGGALVTPVYVTEDFAAFRSASPTVWEQLTTARPLPDYGLTVELPGIASGATVAAQGSENVAPTETDPTAGYRSVAVATHVGEVTVSQQLYDRAGPTSFDTIIYLQLRTQLDADVDGAVIAAMLAAPNTVTRTTSTTLTLGQFLADVGQASAKLETTAGTRMAPSGVAAAANIGEWLLAQTTTNGDPWFRSTGAVRQAGVTGQATNGGVPILLDDNLPAASGNAQLLVAAKLATYVYSGEPILEVLPEGGLAGQLSATVRLRQYVAPVVRYAAGISVITGSGYPASPTWA